MDDFMDLHVAGKRKALSKAKKDFELKIAFARKKKDCDEEAVIQIEA